MKRAGELARQVEAARRAAARAVRRPRHEVAAALARAAARWRTDRELLAGLPAECGLSPAATTAAVAIAADALDAGAMRALAERELDGDPAPPAWLVAHVLASNVPALAVPAIALGCLAGAAVVLKSGRGDRLSAPAFRRALAVEDAELAATIVTAYWPAGDPDAERAVLGNADVVVGTGHDATIAALARRVGDRLVAHGERTSVVVAGPDAPAGSDDLARAVALDVALHDQRGCLSPTAVYVAGDAAALAERLAAALATLAGELPPGPVDDAARAAHRTALAGAEWGGATVFGGPEGRVLLAPDAALRPSPGRRTVWVHPLAPLAEVLARGRVECVGAAGATLDPAALRALGVSRVCRPGRMQRPSLSWPRGQLAPLRTLLRRPAEPQLAVELA